MLTNIRWTKSTLCLWQGKRLANNLLAAERKGENTKEKVFLWSSKRKIIPHIQRNSCGPSVDNLAMLSKREDIHMCTTLSFLFKKT